MFVLDEGIGRSFSQPLLVAGSLAVLTALPLFLTSTRRAQRSLGMRRWRLLHRLTYVVAAALVAHVILVGDIGLGAVLIGLGAVARIPAVRSWIEQRGSRDRHRTRERRLASPGVSAD